jgi:hypothetical protein
MNSKIGQGTGSAFGLVLFIMAFIILYIVLLPSGDRDWLLYGNETGTSLGTSNGTTPDIIFSQSNIQLASALNDDNFELAIEPFELYTKIQKTEYLKINPVHVTRSIIFNNKKSITFDVENFKDLKDLELRFKANKAVGKLKIKVNDYLISEIDQSEFESYKDLRNPIVISKSVLKETGNELSFEVSSPGVYFWRVNDYDISNIVMFEDVEIYNQQATVTFDFSHDELVNIKDVSLVYGVIVTNPNNIDISLNNRLIFSGEPTAERESTHKLLASDIKEHNSLTFISKKGSYNFFDIVIKGTYKENEDKTYYFTVDQKKKKYEITFDLIDTVNQKRFIFYINDHSISVDTTSNTVVYDITDWINTGRNALTFVSSGSVAISNVKITER